MRLLYIRALLAVLVMVMVLPTLASSQASDVALTGRVTSDAEGAMEGVLVSARRDGATFKVTVVSNAEGVYAFPRDRLQPGRYTISTLAKGYVLRPASPSVDVTARSAVERDLRLETGSILETALQLSSAEWLASYPLSDEVKFSTLRDCTRCHTHTRIAMSTWRPEQLPYIMQRMNHSSGSTPLSYQIPENMVESWGRGDGIMGSTSTPSPFEQRQAEAVAAVNLRNGTWEYELKPFPRPTGDATKVIYTTYDLRVLSKPHDARVGPDGWIYYNDFNDTVIGKLNPVTGETKEYRYDYSHLRQRPEYALVPVGSRTMTYDGRGKFYINTQEAEIVVVFDAATETFEYYPGTRGMVSAQSSHVDGWAWVNREWNSSDNPLAPPGGGQLRRAKFLGEGEWITETVESAGGSLSSYDSYADTKNNVYGAGRGSRAVYRVDAKTLEATFYPIPAEPRGVGGLGGGMRRGQTDGQDRMWWGGFDGGFVGRLDPRLPAGQEMKLYVVPLPWFQPYSAEYDDAGYTWTSSISGNYAARLNEQTEEWDLYPLPVDVNSRDIEVQASTEPGGLSSAWIAGNHGGVIVHVEPLAR
jgi:streptogramin lyase